MEEMEEKIGAILSNPDMMNQIMAMAQALNQQNSTSPEQPAPPPQPQKSPPQKPQPSQGRSAPPPAKQSPLPIGKTEIELIQKLSKFSQQTGLDKEQQALLKALNPYLSHDRIRKLEKAMHAAKLAKFASVALEQSGGQLKFGR